MENALKSAVLALEFLLGGALMFFAIAVWIIALNSASLPSASSIDFSKLADLSKLGAIGALVGAAIAYALGILTEYLGFLAFEPVLDRAKHVRLLSELKARPDGVVASNLQTSYPNEPVPTLASASDFYGAMRIHIQKTATDLSAEIDSQIARLRFARMIVVAASVSALGSVAPYFLGTPPFRQELPWLLFILTAVAIGTMLHRTDRYCRSIERAYREAAGRKKRRSRRDQTKT